MSAPGCRCCPGRARGRDVVDDVRRSHAWARGQQVVLDVHGAAPVRRIRTVPLWKSSKTGQVISYRHRPYPVLTARRPGAAQGRRVERLIRPEGTAGVTVPSRRWTFERTLARPCRNRRLARGPRGRCRKRRHRPSGGRLSSRPGDPHENVHTFGTGCKERTVRYRSDARLHGQRPLIEGAFAGFNGYHCLQIIVWPHANVESPASV